MAFFFVLLAPVFVAAGGFVAFFVGLWRHSMWWLGGGVVAFILGCIGTALIASNPPEMP